MKKLLRTIFPTTLSEMLCSALLLITTIITGCIPYNREVVVAPKIEGIVIRDGAPVRDMIVSYGRTKEEACLNPKERATTNSLGEFSFNGEIEQRSSMVLMPVHEHRSWGLCFKKDALTADWYGYTYGPESAPALLEIECNLSPLDRSASVNTVSTTKGERICRYLKPLRTS